jgi:hypothetical protein
LQLAVAIVKIPADIVIVVIAAIAIAIANPPLHIAILLSVKIDNSSFV